MKKDLESALFFIVWFQTINPTLENRPFLNILLLFKKLEAEYHDFVITPDPKPT